VHMRIALALNHTGLRPYHVARAQAGHIPPPPSLYVPDFLWGEACTRAKATEAECARAQLENCVERGGGPTGEVSEV